MSKAQKIIAGCAVIVVVGAMCVDAELLVTGCSLMGVGIMGLVFAPLIADV